jgi:hypothetical protein
MPTRPALHQRRRLMPFLSPQNRPVTSLVPYTLGIAESVGPATDSVVRTVAYVRSIGETAGPAADSVARALAAARAPVETVGPAADTTTRSLSIQRLIAETVIASDAAQRLLGRYRLITETVGPALDSVGAVKGHDIVFDTDALALGWTVGRLGTRWYVVTGPMRTGWSTRGGLSAEEV